MTPAINEARRHGIAYTVHEYRHDPKAASYGLEAAEKLGLSPDRVFKTLIAELDAKELVVAVLPVDCQLSLKNLARALGGKRVAMAERTAVQRSTGYVLGGVSPLGQKKHLRTVLDATAAGLSTIFVSAGRRGLEIELAPADILRLCQASYGEIAER